MKYQKLSALILKLEKAREDYVAKYGIDPTIWEWDEDDGLQLSAGVKRDGGASTSLRPYKSYKNIKPVTW